MKMPLAASKIPTSITMPGLHIICGHIDMPMFVVGAMDKPSARRNLVPQIFTSAGRRLVPCWFTGMPDVAFSRGR